MFRGEFVAANDGMFGSKDETEGLATDTDNENEEAQPTISSILEEVALLREELTILREGTGQVLKRVGALEKVHLNSNGHLQQVTPMRNASRAKKNSKKTMHVADTDTSGDDEDEEETDYEPGTASGRGGRSMTRKKSSATSSSPSPSAAAAARLERDKIGDTIDWNEKKNIKAYSDAVKHALENSEFASGGVNHAAVIKFFEEKTGQKMAKKVSYARTQLTKVKAMIKASKAKRVESDDDDVDDDEEEDDDEDEKEDEMVVDSDRGELRIKMPRSRYMPGAKRGMQKTVTPGKAKKAKKAKKAFLSAAKPRTNPTKKRKMSRPKTTSDSESDSDDSEEEEEEEEEESNDGVAKRKKGSNKKIRVEVSESYLDWKDDGNIESFNNVLDEATHKRGGVRGPLDKKYDVAEIIALFEKHHGIRLTDRSVKKRLTLLHDQEKQIAAYTKQQMPKKK
jgi:hypothetical protein